MEDTSFAQKNLQGRFTSKDGVWAADDEESFSVEEIDLLVRMGGHDRSQWHKILRHYWNQKLLSPKRKKITN